MGLGVDREELVGEVRGQRLVHERATAAEAGDLLDLRPLAGLGQADRLNEAGVDGCPGFVDRLVQLVVEPPLAGLGLEVDEVLAGAAAAHASKLDRDELHPPAEVVRVVGLAERVAVERHRGPRVLRKHFEELVALSLSRGDVVFACVRVVASEGVGDQRGVDHRANSPMYHVPRRDPYPADALIHSSPENLPLAQPHLGAGLAVDEHDLAHLQPGGGREPCA